MRLENYAIITLQGLSKTLGFLDETPFTIEDVLKVKLFATCAVKLENRTISEPGDRPIVHSIAVLCTTHPDLLTYDELGLIEKIRTQLILTKINRFGPCCGHLLREKDSLTWWEIPTKLLDETRKD